MSERSDKALETGESNGAPDRIRTCGLRLRRPTLYPAELRAHTDKATGRLARPAGLEPATYGFEVRRYIQLSYGRTETNDNTPDSSYCLVVPGG